jgi:Dyp-type peroxidase family
VHGGAGASEGAEVTVSFEHPLDLGASGAASLLAELQPNILKAHVRNHLAVLLLTFTDEADARKFLRDLADGELMKSAKQHIDEVKAYKADKRTRGTPYVGVALSFEGYAALGIPASRRPADRSFRRGMSDPATRAALRDPSPSTWEAPYRAPIHAIVLIGDASEAKVSSTRAKVLGLKRDSVIVVGEETGLYQRNDDGDGIEHFGYVDGRSQPLFIKQDVDEERATKDGATVWDPGFPLKQILVRDRAGSIESYGSYLVFRKLEQNVQRFKEEEDRLADDLDLEGEDRERAGAMLVGRFEDGTPVTLQGEGGAHHPVMNDFTYASDGKGMKCPFYAHTRKVNPRDRATRAHVMARRGQTYGVRADDPSDEDVPSNRRPTGGVGLLFMAFNAHIARQFEFTQGELANKAGAGDTAGMDPIIGQGRRSRVRSPECWAGVPRGDLRRTDPVAAAVTMKGGEYFFAPSLTFLRKPQ